MSTILMIDDTALFQLLETSFLKRTGCRVVRAIGRDDCLAKARAMSPDLIVLTTDHPALGGPDCIRELKSDPATGSTPVLALTSAEEARVCADAGADVILKRPVSRKALVEVLERYGCTARRDGDRRSAHMPAQVATTGEERRGRVKDISRSGMFVAMPKPLPVDQSVDLSLRLPGPAGDRTLRARGIVVRRVTDDPESHLIPGVGVRFTELDAATESLLDFFVGQAILGQDPLEPEDEDKNRA